jgi:hypothetical protein
MVYLPIHISLGLITGVLKAPMEYCLFQICEGKVIRELLLMLSHQDWLEERTAHFSAALRQSNYRLAVSCKSHSNEQFGSQRETSQTSLFYLWET